MTNNDDLVRGERVPDPRPRKKLSREEKIGAARAALPRVCLGGPKHGTLLETGDRPVIDVPTGAGVGSDRPKNFHYRASEVHLGDWCIPCWVPADLDDRHTFAVRRLKELDARLVHKVRLPLEDR